MEFPYVVEAQTSLPRNGFSGKERGETAVLLYSQVSQRLKTLILQVNSWNFNILPKVKIEISISGSVRLRYIIPDFWGEILGIKKKFRKSQEF